MNIRHAIRCGLGLEPSVPPHFFMQPTQGKSPKMRGREPLVPLRRAKIIFDNSQDTLFTFESPEQQPIYIREILIDAQGKGEVSCTLGEDELLKASPAGKPYTAIVPNALMNGTGSGDVIVATGPKPPSHSKKAIAESEKTGEALPELPPTFTGVAYILYMPA